jgi:hypothetical protein
MGDHRINVTRSQLVKAVRRLELKQRQLEIGMGASQPREGIWEEMLRCARKRSDSQRADLPAALPHGKLSESDIGQEPLAADTQSLAGRRRSHTPRTPNEQLTTKIAFEQRDVLRDRWSCIAQGLCGGCE